MSHESVTPRPWSDCPWLDLRAAELCRTTGFASTAIYRAAKTLWQAGVPDEKAADILVTIESEGAQIMGPEAWIDNLMIAIDPDWLERRAL